MGFGEFKDRLPNLGEEHGEKIEQGLDKAADAAKEKSGHEEQIDKGVEKGEELLADSDRDPASSGSRRTSPPGAC